MTELELRWVLTATVNLTLAYLIFKRIVTFDHLKIPGKRVAYDYKYGYLLMCIGAFATGLYSFQGEVLSWTQIITLLGLVTVLVRSSNSWTLTKMPEVVLTDEPPITVRVKAWLETHGVIDWLEQRGIGKNKNVER